MHYSRADVNWLSSFCYENGEETVDSKTYEQTEQN